MHSPESRRRAARFRWLRVSSSPGSRVKTVLCFLAVVLCGLLRAAAPSTEPAAPAAWLPASPERLPRWRGFNLLEKFNAAAKPSPFLEEDFRLISKLGFNFVRLPMDYRCWIQDGNWEQFDEKALREIDQAVAWGEKYHLHVCLNFHRAPGYTVAKPPEKTDLWTDPEAQRICAKHWAMFAQRYKAIPNERLSFNLVNEPGGAVTAEKYAAVVRRLAAAIHAEDPNRLIIADGHDWGWKPTLELAQLKEVRVAQSGRGYAPMEVSHYHANWVQGSATYPVPQWPMIIAPTGILLSPEKPEGTWPMIIDGPFTAATTLRLHLLKVSRAADLVVEADGKPLWNHAFVCGAGEGEWKTAVLEPKFKVYQNIFDKDYSLTIPKDTKQVQIRITAGDWLQLTQLGLKPAGAADAGATAPAENVLNLSDRFGAKPEPFRYAPQDAAGPFPGLAQKDRQWLWNENVVPWQKLEAQNTGILIGEWGAFNQTPHEVVLRWAEDNLANWKKADWGWALWNFRGSFGILDSGRTDITYENWEGHKLDRQLLELLQKY